MADLRSLLAGVALLAVMAAPARAEPVAAIPDDCGYCPAIVAQLGDGQARSAGLAACEALVGQQVELGAYRSAFLIRPRYVDLFPTIYWHVTEIDFRRLAAGDFRHPLETMDEVLAFYDAYKVNRIAWETGGRPEPHWSKAYGLAQEADADFGAIGQGSVVDTPQAVRDVLAAAMTAHIAYDLPRAVRETFKPTPGRVSEPAELKDDFFATDQTINASMASAGEIYHAIQTTSTWRKDLLGDSNLAVMANGFAEANALVLNLRHRAWDVAVAGGELPTGAAAQPRTDRDQLRAKGRGVCQGGDGRSPPLG